MDEPDKPNAAALRWETRTVARPYRNETLTLRVDSISIRGQNEMDYAYLERADAVIVVPVTRDGQIVTLRQYRYPTDDWCLEIPAGGTHDTGEDSLRDVARKELREEIGATSPALTYIGFFYSAPSMSDEKCHVFFAENVDILSAPDTEASEEIRIQLHDAGEVISAVRAGEMKNSPCALAILLCEPLMQQRGYL